MAGEANSEKLTVTEFLSISKCEIEIPRICAIIGPQASGKSIVVKLVYFFREYIEDYLFQVIGDAFGLREFKSRKTEELISLFKGLEAFEGNSKATYVFNEFRIDLEKRGRVLKLSHNRELTKLGSFLKRRYRKFIAEEPQDRSRRYMSSVFDFQSRDDDVSEIYDGAPATLFVPASRSFYSTVSSEVFTFLASDKRIDPLTSQFGRFYDFAKRQLSGEIPGRDSDERRRLNLTDSLVPVIKGRYSRERGKDYIVTDWGRVPLDASSSGQQESLPLLVSIICYPNSHRKGDRLIIEEPEAHLFPDSQKKVLDLMVQCAVENNSGVLFTTHSPYILACLNSHIVRFIRNNPEERSEFGAFIVASGKVSSLLDEDLMIDLNELDRVSNDIAEELMLAYSDE